jgi:hypothetical protein
MPNWCVNQVEISGDPELVAKAVAFAADEHSAFSFEKIVPPPSGEIYSVGEGQNDFQCGCEAVYVGEAPNGKWLVNGKPIERVDAEGNSIEEQIDNMFGGTEVCPDHKLARISSHPDWWYNWNIKHWGTKWSAKEVYVSDRADGDSLAEYEFETAWGPAIPVSAALAKAFPGLKITHRYCEGGNGYAGYVVFDHEGALDSAEYEAEELLEGAFMDDDRWERDYDKVPPTEFEAFALEHFGGVVGG